jgi:hypothetical protein
MSDIDEKVIEREKKFERNTVASIIAFSAYIVAMIDLHDEIESGLIDTGDGAEE